MIDIIGWVAIIFVALALGFFVFTVVYAVLEAWTYTHSDEWKRLTKLTKKV